jgi:hypothetical protein
MDFAEVPRRLEELERGTMVALVRRGVTERIVDRDLEPLDSVGWTSPPIILTRANFHAHFE